MRLNACCVILAGLVSLLIITPLSTRRHPSLITKAHADEKGCSVATLRGAYGFYRTGTSGTTSPSPIAAVGIAFFDGHGNNEFRQTSRKSGVNISDMFTDPPTQATYQVESDCTGKSFLTDGSPLFHMVVVQGGREVYFLSQSQSPVTAYGVMRRIGLGEDSE